MVIKGKKIIVTGGTGFIGSHIVDALLEEGVLVVIVDNNESNTIHNISHLKGRVKLHRVSVTDLKALKKIFTGAHAIIHHAALVSVPQSIDFPKRYHETNALGTLNVFIAAHYAGVDRVIYTSSSAVYGDDPTFPKKETMRLNPLSPYAVQKLVGELYGAIFFNLHGLKTIGLRYFNVFGPRQDPHSDYAAVIPRFVSLMKKGKQPHIYGDGHQTRDFIYVNDIVNANLMALKTSTGFGQVYNIAGERRISLNELVKKINKILGSSIMPKYMPAKKGDIKHSYADISKAKKIIHFKIKTSFDDGLKEVVDHL